MVFDDEKHDEDVAPALLGITHCITIPSIVWHARLKSRKLTCMFKFPNIPGDEEAASPTLFYPNGRVHL